MKKVLSRKASSGDVLYYMDGGRKRTPWHPWKVTPYISSNGKWSATVEPGFVNGIDPRCPAAEDAYKKNAKDKASEIEIGLCDKPEIPMSEFALVSNPSEYFLNLGVKKQASNISIEGGQLTIDETHSSESGGKILLKNEIFLSVARASYKLSVDYPMNWIQGEYVNYSVQFDTQTLNATGSRGRIYTASKMPSPDDVSLLDRLMGAYQDDGEDRLLLATVYFISPEGADPTSASPAWDWEPYVKHNVFWNLGYAAKNLPPQNPTARAGVDPALAYFVGRYTFAPMAALGAMQSMEQAIMAALFNNTSNEGKFWTV